MYIIRELALLRAQAMDASMPPPMAQPSQPAAAAAHAPRSPPRPQQLQQQDAGRVASAGSAPAPPGPSSGALGPGPQGDTSLPRYRSWHPEDSADTARPRDGRAPSMGLSGAGPPKAAGQTAAGATGLGPQLRSAPAGPATQRGRPADGQQQQQQQQQLRTMPPAAMGGASGVELNRGKLQALLEAFGEYPDKYRLIVW